MPTYRYLDKDRNFLEEHEFGTDRDAEDYRMMVLGAQIIEEVGRSDDGAPES